MKVTIKSALPDITISHFVHSFWMLENKTGKDVITTLLPNAMVDMVVMKTDSEKWETFIRGIDTEYSQITITENTKMFAVGLKLLAVEYLLGNSIKDVLNEGKSLTDDLWQFEESDRVNLESFSKKATQIIKNISTENIDSRKQKLFELIYASNGSITVKELSEKANWSSRQINRYFNQQFGVSLKTYCKILRFGASFKPLSEGNLFPEENFTDQNHYIKEIKKYSGVTPKELSKNKNDKFIDIVAVKNYSS